MSVLNRTYNLIVLFSLFSLSINSQIVFDGAEQTNPYTVTTGITETYSNAYFNKKNSVLNINGTLIIQGDLILNKKDSQLNMGLNGILIVHGNLDISNTVNLNLNNLVLIHGNIIGSSGAGNSATIDITNTRFYLFGTPSTTPLISCSGTYTGTTATQADSCHYGNETDYINNYENGFTDAEKALLSCYSIADPISEEICPASAVTFKTTDNPGLAYTWQVRSPTETDFSDIAGANRPQYNIASTTAAIDLNEYRVIARNNAAGACKIEISEPATLDVVIESKWTGATDQNWNNSKNWFCTKLPDLSDDVLIPADATRFPLINSGVKALANSINVEDGANIEVLDNSLEISGDLNITTGNLNVISGKLIFSGSAPQFLSAELFQNEIEDLEVNNPSGLELNAPLQVTGSVLLSNGDLTTNSNLTLVSDATQTALIDGSGSGNMVGTVTMQRYIDPAFGYKYISSPFSDSTVGDLSAYLSPATDYPNLFYYNENREYNNSDVTGWIPYTNAAGALEIMTGYAANFGTSAGSITLELTGTVNDGTFQKTLQNNAGTYTKGFHLVGNPYPSPIDWNAASGWTRTNIGNAAYFFSADASDQYTGSYTSFVNDISTSGTASAVIPSMQGFFIHVDDGTTGTFGMTNEVRINDFDQEFFKAQETERSLMRIVARFSNKEQEDAMVIYRDNFSSKNYESERDALKLFNTNQDIPNLYMIAGQKNISINALPTAQFMSDELLPLGLEVKHPGKIQISLKDLIGFDKSTRVFLIDKKLKKYKELNKQYYEFNAEKGLENSRFYLSFEEPKKSDLATSDTSFVVITKYESIQVKMKLSAFERGSLQLWSLDGKLIESREVSGNNEGNLNFGSANAKGVYLICYSSENIREVKKVIVK